MSPVPQKLFRCTEKASQKINNNKSIVIKEIIDSIEETVGLLI